MRGHSARGGAGRIFLTGVADADAAPQHGLDVALAQAVLRKMDTCRRATCAKGERNLQTLGTYAFAKDMVRQLVSNPWRTLSLKQRAALERRLKPDVLEKVYTAAKAVAGVGRDAPKCLWPENLPKKPPGRR
jgi:hypothetical protein